MHAITQDILPYNLLSYINRPTQALPDIYICISFNLQLFYVIVFKNISYKENADFSQSKNSYILVYGLRNVHLL